MEPQINTKFYWGLFPWENAQFTILDGEFVEAVIKNHQDYLDNADIVQEVFINLHKENILEQGLWQLTFSNNWTEIKIHNDLMIEEEDAT